MSSQKENQSLIQSEHDREAQLINHRLTWLLASQTFLIGLMGLLLKDLNQLSNTAKALIHKLPWGGLAITTWLLIGIIGAYIAMFKLDPHLETTKIKGITPRICGAIASILTSLTFLVLWVVIICTLG